MPDQPETADDATTQRPLTVEEIVASRGQGLVAADEPGQPRQSEVLRVAASNVAGAAQTAVADGVVNPVRDGLLLLVLTIPALLVAIPIFAASALVYVAIGAVLGYPGGTIAGILGIAWFVGTLVLVFLAFVAIYRLGRRFVRRRRARRPSSGP